MSLEKRIEMYIKIQTTLSDAHDEKGDVEDRVRDELNSRLLNQDTLSLWDVV